MSKRKPRNINPSKFVTHAECGRIMDEVNSQLKAIKTTLIGEDMRGGLVADVQAIKSATGIIKTVILPIVLSVSAALITYAVLHVL